MVAAVVLFALRRLLNDDFFDPCDFFIETASGVIVSQPRLLLSRSEWLLASLQSVKVFAVGQNADRKSESENGDLRYFLCGGSRSNKARK